MKHLNNKSGMTIIGALIIMLVAAVFVTALFAYANNNVLQTKTMKNQKTAQYLARSGIEMISDVWNDVSNNSAERATEPVYLLPDGSYQTVKDGDDPPDDFVGYYTVVINPDKQVDTDGDGIEDTTVVEFTSTAVVGGSAATKTAYIMPSFNALDSEWYDNAGYPNMAKLKEMDELTLSNSTVMPGSSYVDNMKSAMFPGNIYFEKPAGTAVDFSLKVDKNRQFIAYAGRMLYLDMGITMNSRSSSKSILVLSGGDIIVTGDIELYVYYGVFGSGIGTVILSVLEDYGHIDPTRTEDGAVYGKVYFYGDVYITTARFLRSERKKIFSKGEVYYFDGMENGVDLVKYYVDNEGAGGVISDFIKGLYPGTEKVERGSMRLIQPGATAGDEPSALIPPSLDDNAVVVWTS